MPTGRSKVGLVTWGSLPVYLKGERSTTALAGLASGGTLMTLLPRSHAIVPLPPAGGDPLAVVDACQWTNQRLPLASLAGAKAAVRHSENHLFRTAKGITDGFSHPSPVLSPSGRGCSGQLFLSRS